LKVLLRFPDIRLLWDETGQTAALLIASEIVVLGQVRGNCQASDRLEIRNEGSMSGDAVVSRISIADGAVVKGNIDIRRLES
jgi:cytoskeletal protein CcmA (bactofilin family)